MRRCSSSSAGEGSVGAWGCGSVPGPRLHSSRLASSLLSARVRAGTVSSIKMLLEQQCAVVTYTKEDDCDRAIQGLNVRTHDAQRLQLGKNYDAKPKCCITVT